MRYHAGQSDEERHGFGNLILMCPAHHKVIDEDLVTWTVEELERIKAEHERAHVSGPEPGRSLFALS